MPGDGHRGDAGGIKFSDGEIGLVFAAAFGIRPGFCFINFRI